MPCGCPFRNKIRRMGEYELSELSDVWNHEIGMLQYALAHALNTKTHNCSLISDDNPCGWEK